MSELKVCLFRRFSIYREDQILNCLNSQKAIELFCYLLIYRNQSLHREILADKLWRGIKVENSRKYLRKALWQLQSSLYSVRDCQVGDFLRIEPEWLKVDTRNYLWLDIEYFEEAFQRVRKVKGIDLNHTDYIALKRAIDIYEGDLLEGWYQSWCIIERERFKEMLIAMVGKLMSYCEANQDFESGIEYGNQLLRQDRAHERTHRRLMRIQYLAGDRTSAIRQFERCKEILQEELSVKPSERTNRLFQEIVGGNENLSQDFLELMKSHLTSSNPTIINTLSQIKNLMVNQVSEQEKIIRTINELENEFKEFE